MKATIITIGDEILIGQIVDTNSVSIAKHLNAAGIVVHEKVSIGDDSTQIVRSVERALGDSNVVVITGGLGPTKDDITSWDANFIVVGGRRQADRKQLRIKSYKSSTPLASSRSTPSPSR